MADTVEHHGYLQIEDLRVRELFRLLTLNIDSLQNVTELKEKSKF